MKIKFYSSLIDNNTSIFNQEQKIKQTLMPIYLIYKSFCKVNSTTKCNFEQLGKEAKDFLVSKALGPGNQSSHDLSTPVYKINAIRFISS